MLIILKATAFARRRLLLLQSSQYHLYYYLLHHFFHPIHIQVYKTQLLYRSATASHIVKKKKKNERKQKKISAKPEDKFCSITNMVLILIVLHFFHWLYWIRVTFQCKNCIRLWALREIWSILYLNSWFMNSARRANEHSRMNERWTRNRMNLMAL